MGRILGGAVWPGGALKTTQNFKVGQTLKIRPSEFHAAPRRCPAAPRSGFSPAGGITRVVQKIYLQNGFLMATYFESKSASQLFAK